MKLVAPGYEILTEISDGGVKELQQIEKIARVCYKSEDRISADGESAKKMIAGLIKSDHLAMLEHSTLSVLFTVDRGISHELVRHRMASFAQESTRYVASSKKHFKEVVSDEDILYAYSVLGLSMKKIADKSNGKYRENDIYKFLLKNDVPIRNIGSRGICNSDFFDSIDTPEKAYLLGFIQADGSIRRDLSSFSISQKSDDIWFLTNMFRDFIQDTVTLPIIHNKHMCEALYDKGIVPNKTYEDNEHLMLKLWESVPFEFKYDFIRGLMDGDGSIRWYFQNDRSKTQSFTVGFLGNKWILDIIHDFLSRDLNKKITPPKKDLIGECYKLFLSGHDDGVKFCENLYKNFVFPYGHSKTMRYYQSSNKIIPVKYDVGGVGDFNVVVPTELLRPENCNALWVWGSAMFTAELAYNRLLNMGASPQIARSVLPNSTKTNITVTANYREWRHIFALRAVGTTGAPHPQMQEIMIPLLKEVAGKIPVVFDDLAERV